MSSEVYVLGQNTRNQVGNEFETSSTITKWTPIEKYRRYGKIKQIAFGANFSIALLYNNILIVAGDNSHWTIGGHFGKNFKYITQLLPWTFFSKNKLPNMAYSQKKSKRGRRFCQLCVFAKTRQRVPVPLFFFQNACHIHKIYASPAANQVFALCENGDLYAWGDNSQNSLGLDKGPKNTEDIPNTGNFEDRLAIPTKCTWFYPQEIIDIQICKNRVLFIVGEKEERIQLIIKTWLRKSSSKKHCPNEIIQVCLAFRAPPPPLFFLLSLRAAIQSEK